MRHILANIFTYSLIAALVIGAGLFAWARNAQLVFAHERDVEPVVLGAERPATEADWFAFGRHTYLVNCQNCHTADGSGRGMYPPIQQMTAHLAAEGGRDYLVNLALYGLYTGTYGAPMPPMPELSDAEIAAVTNYMLVQFAAEGEGPEASQLYLAPQVAALRGQQLNEWGVAALRPAIPTAEELGRGVQVHLTTDRPAVPEGTDE